MFSRQLVTKLPSSHRSPSCLVCDRSTSCLVDDRSLSCLVGNQWPSFLVGDRSPNCLVSDQSSSCLVGDRSTSCIIFKWFKTFVICNIYGSYWWYPIWEVTSCGLLFHSVSTAHSNDIKMSYHKKIPKFSKSKYYRLCILLKFCQYYNVFKKLVLVDSPF